MKTSESVLTYRGDRAHRHVPDEFCVDLITNYGDAIVDVFEIASGPIRSGRNPSMLIIKV